MAGRGDFQPYTKLAPLSVCSGQSRSMSRSRPASHTRQASAFERLFWAVKVKVKVKTRVTVNVKVKVKVKAELFSATLRAQKANPAALRVRVKVAIKGLLTNLNLFDLPTNAGPLSG